MERVNVNSAASYSLFFHGDVLQFFLMIPSTRCVKKALSLTVAVFMLPACAMPTEGLSYLRAVPIRDASAAQKAAMIRYAYAVMRGRLKSPETAKTFAGGLQLPEFGYDKVFVTIYHDNRVVGCQRGAAKAYEEKRLSLDLAEAAIRSLEDKRFAEKLVVNDLADTTVVMSFLFNKRRLRKNDLVYLKGAIEPGIDSISIARGEKRAYFLSSVPI